MKDQHKNRRQFLKRTALLTVAGFGATAFHSSLLANTPGNLNESTVTGEAEADFAGPFSLPALPYDYAALEPHIDKLTMQIHHDKHHQAYVDNLNKAVTEAKIENVTLADLCKNASRYPVAVRNNGGGHFNHSFFWTFMKPGGGGTPSGKLGDAINSQFGSFNDFKTKFSAAAASRFGSGWAWLVANNGKLEIGSTPNQDNPLMDVSDFKGTPLLGLDVWEHSYYLKYQNKRADYIAAFWNVVNWETVAKQFDQV